MNVTLHSEKQLFPAHFHKVLIEIKRVCLEGVFSIAPTWSTKKKIVCKCYDKRKNALMNVWT